jgi:glycosyltransferase involved in cell wall biosynthesis
MKHVWILNHHAAEPRGSGGTRHHMLAQHLLAHGWQAHLIAASVEHQSGRQRLGPEERLRHETCDGVPFLWVRTSPYAGNGLGRIRNMLQYTRAVLRRKTLSRLPRPDVVIGSSVHPLAAWAGSRLARRHGVPFVFEVRDLWPQTLIDMGSISARGPASVALRRLERVLYRRADRIVTLLPHAAEYIEAAGGAGDRIDHIPNGVDLRDWPAPSEVRDNAPFRFMYFGAHGGANGLHVLLQAWSLLKRSRPNQEFHLRLVGDGPAKRSLMEMARSLEIPDVSFEDPVPKHRVPELAEAADALVFTLADVPVFRFGISSNKLFDYLASGRPIVFSCASSNDPVQEAGAGISVPPDDPAALAEAMGRMLDLPATSRRAMGEAGRRHIAANHDVATLSRRLAETLALASEKSR